MELIDAPIITSETYKWKEPKETFTRQEVDEELPEEGPGKTAQ